MSVTPITFNIIVLEKSFEVKVKRKKGGDFRFGLCNLESLRNPCTYL